MAGRWCKLAHPNQVKRQYESAAEGQVASLKNQAVAQQQEIAQQKNILLSQIEALSLDSRQQIESEYQASYLAIIEEFAKSQAIHEESLIALSYFWVYGTATSKTGLINWSRMAWRSITQDNSPEVISWQQNNRNRFPTTAAFFDSIANSKSQKVVNAFADEFAGRPVMFVKEELSLIQQGERTKTAQFVVNTAEALKDAKEFVIQDAKIFINGDTTQTEIFFETVEQFIAADYERLRAGQATVIGTAIGTAIAEDFRSLANMRSSLGARPMKIKIVKKNHKDEKCCRYS